MSAVGKPYLPSHGSAAESFVVGWCGNCDRDATGGGCPIILAWFRGEEPPEIVVYDNGSPLCTAFSDRKGDT